MSAAEAQAYLASAETQAALIAEGGGQLIPARV